MRGAVQEREAEAAVLDGEKRKLETMHERLGQGADVAMQALHKEIECLRLAQAQAVVGGAKSADIAGQRRAGLLKEAPTGTSAHECHESAADFRMDHGSHR